MMTNHMAFYQFCSAVRRRGLLALCLALCTLGGLGGSARDPRPTYITFDAPGAGTDPGQGTTPNGIDAQGAVVGWYVDAGNVNHGFLRTP